jgi:hypothetical protein
MPPSKNKKDGSYKSHGRGANKKENTPAPAPLSRPRTAEELNDSLEELHLSFLQEPGTPSMEERTRQFSLSAEKSKSHLTEITCSERTAAGNQTKLAKDFSAATEKELDGKLSRALELVEDYKRKKEQSDADKARLRNSKAVLGAELQACRMGYFYLLGREVSNRILASCVNNAYSYHGLPIPARYIGRDQRISAKRVLDQWDVGEHPSRRQQQMERHLNSFGLSYTTVKQWDDFFRPAGDKVAHGILFLAIRVKQDFASLIALLPENTLPTSDATTMANRCDVFFRPLRGPVFCKSKGCKMEVEPTIENGELCCPECNEEL